MSESRTDKYPLGFQRMLPFRLHDLPAFRRTMYENSSRDYVYRRQSPFLSLLLRGIIASSH